MKSFSKLFLVGASIFILMAYAGIYFLATGDVPTGRTFMEWSMVPGYLGLAAQCLFWIKNRREERGYSRCIGR